MLESEKKVLEGKRLSARDPTTKGGKREGYGKTTLISLWTWNQRESKKNKETRTKRGGGLLAPEDLTTSKEETQPVQEPARNGVKPIGDKKHAFRTFKTNAQKGERRRFKGGKAVEETHLQ